MNIAKNNPKISNIMEQIGSGETKAALTNLEKIFNKAKNLKKFKPQEIQVLHLLRGLCMIKETQLGQPERIFDEFSSEECKTDLEINNETVKWLEGFAYSLNKYKELRIVYERYYNNNSKNIENKLKYL